MRDFIPKAASTRSVQLKFITTPLTAPQTKELLQQASP
jgi:hypothetical protein